jgi:hypothetical protein
MKVARFGALAVAALVMVCASMVKADEIEVQFSGVVTNSNGPAVSVGDSFSGYFTYSAGDPFDILFLGQSEYSLTSPEDSEFVAVDGIDVTVHPLTGVHAFVVPSTESFFTQDFVAPGTPGISLTFSGNSDFLTSGSLPDPFKAQDFTSGNIGFGFSLDDVDYSVQGNITQVSNVPEPRGSLPACVGILALVFLLRRSAHILSIVTRARRFATPAV